MWLFTKYGFYRAVCSRQGDGSHRNPVNPDRIVVRAHLRQHLEALISRFPDVLRRYEIHQYSVDDYVCQLIVEKSVWSKVVAGIIEEIDYENFESEAVRYQWPDGREYEHTLHEVCDVMNRLQE